MKNNKYKIFMIFSMALLAIAIIVSSTYAYYVWTTSDSDTTKIVAGVGAATVTFDGGSDISANLRPVSDKSKGIVKNISVKGDTEGLVFNMYLDITSIDTGLKDESFRYELYKGTTKVKEGDFSDSYLTSNTVTCTKNNTNHIVLLTNESISMSKTSYTLYIWIDGENYTNPNTMMNKTFSFKLHADGEGAVLAKTAAQTIAELYTTASKTTVTNNSITYNKAPSVLLMNDRLGGTTEDLDGGNIRYYGASPKNYIYFNCETYPDTNCELWRIIGVFDGKLKLIKNENIGTFSWDNKNKSTGAETNSGNNDWTTARLMKLLNPSDYYTVDSNDNNLGQSLYYNSASGKCYRGENNAIVDCDFTSTGIKNEATRDMIMETAWNLGTSNASLSLDAVFESENGTDKCSTCTYETTWIGKIALPYISDFGYAGDLSKCTKTNLFDVDSCKEYRWIYYLFKTYTEGDYPVVALLSPGKNYSSHVTSYSVTYARPSTGWAAYLDFGIFPTLFLSPSTIIVDGDGSESNPYKIN